MQFHVTLNEALLKMSTNIILIKSNFYLNLNKYVTREHSAVESSGSGRKAKECKKIIGMSCRLLREI
jgi:hypothetical protein